MKFANRFVCFVLVILTLTMFFSGCAIKKPISTEYIPENTVVISGEYTIIPASITQEYQKKKFSSLSWTCHYSGQILDIEKWPGTDIPISKEPTSFEFEGIKDEIEFFGLEYLNAKAVIRYVDVYHQYSVCMSRDMKTMKIALYKFNRFHKLEAPEDQRAEAIRYAKMYLDDLDDYVFTEEYINMDGDDYATDALIEYRFTRYVGDVETMEYLSVTFDAWTNKPSALTLSCIGDFEGEKFDLSRYKDYLDAQIDGALKETCETYRLEYKSRIEPYNIRLGKDEYGRSYIRCNVFFLYRVKDIGNTLNTDEDKGLFDTEIELAVYLPE